MENENEKVTHNSDKLLKVLIAMMAVNMIVGIVNIGLVVNKNTSHQRPNSRGMRQEAMFDGFSKENGRSYAFNDEPKHFMKNDNRHNDNRQNFNKNNNFSKMEPSNQNGRNFRNMRKNQNQGNSGERQMPKNENNDNRERRQNDIKNDDFNRNQFQNN